MSEILDFSIFAEQSDETPATMEMSFDELTQLIRAEHYARLEQLLADFQALVDKRLPGQDVSVHSALDISRLDSPLRLYVIISLYAEGQPTPTPALTLPAREPPPMPTLANTKRMAQKVHEKALLFWWPDPAPGVIYILWLDGGWEAVRDTSPANQTGFDWLASGVDLGAAKGAEQHGDGCILITAEGAWIKPPISGAIYFLWPDGEWRLKQLTET